MRITLVAALVPLLVTSNAVTAWLLLKRDPEIRADHLQRVRLNTEGGGTIFMTLGTSDMPGGPVVDNPHHAATLALTPRAAIQIHVELGRVIRGAQEAAAVAQHEEETTADQVQ